MKRLTTVSNAVSAALLQHQLSHEGIESFVVDENVTTILPNLNGMMGFGVQIMVADKDYEKASQVLEKIENSARFTSSPYCGSSNISFGMGGKRRIGEKVVIFFSLLFALPLGNISNKYYCQNCKESFA